MGSKLSEASLERLPIYLNYLQEIVDTTEHISATTIAKELGFGEVLVRKDLAHVSTRGKPKIGYVTSELIDDLNDFLQCNNTTNAVIVGAGKLGRALLGYEGFTRYGVNIKAAFSHHANIVIGITPSKPVLNLESFESYVKANNIGIGIITVPNKYAQEICDLMVSCGIKAIWNFARKTLVVPNDVIVRSEDLAAGIAILNCQLKNKKVR